MKPQIGRWIQHQAQRYHGFRSARRNSRRSWQAERLEDRSLLAVTIGPLYGGEITTPRVGDGKTLYVPITATDDDSNSISYSVTSSNSDVSAEVISGGRSIRMTVSGVDANNDPFTGEITFRLFEDDHPITTARIIELIQSGFYDDQNNIVFHRIIDDFVAQFGDPNGNGTGGSGTEFDDEFNSAYTFASPGVLAMANSGDDTNDSQMFIVDLVDLALLPENLNFNHTILGVITSGYETFVNLIQTPTSGQAPVTPPTLDSIDVFTDDQNGVLRLTSTEGSIGNSTIQVTATAGTMTDTEAFVVSVINDSVNDRAFLGPVTDMTVNENDSVTFTVTGTDLDNDTLTFVVRDADGFVNDQFNNFDDDPQNLTFNIATDQTPDQGATAEITLTPNANFNGVIDLFIGVQDGISRDNQPATAKSNFDTQRIQLTVNSVNSAPTGADQTIATPQDTEIIITLDGDDGDSDLTQTLTFELVGTPANGTISAFNPVNGELTYTPATGFNGNDTFTYRVSDDGGTANGGVDTSELFTVTVAVGDTATPVPTSFDLAADDDTGFRDDDDYTSDNTWTINLEARTGSTVELTINGATITATEDADNPGQFSAEIPAANIQVGPNSITATASLNGDTSDATDPFVVTFAPEFTNSFIVPGAVGETQSLTFEYLNGIARYDNEFGFFVVDDARGRVDGFLPGERGYIDAALARATTVFPQGTVQGTSEDFAVLGGDRIAFFLTADRTVAQYLRQKSENPYIFRNPLGVFSYNNANRDNGRDHLLSVDDSVAGTMELHWEDQSFLGDRDYNDTVVSVRPTELTDVEVAEALRIPGSDGQTIDLEFTLRRAVRFRKGFGAVVAEGEFGYFNVDELDGTINGIRPGEAGYLAEVAARATTLFDVGDRVGIDEVMTLTAGLYGFYYVPGSNITDVSTNNAENDPFAGDVALLSFDAANPSGVEHLRWYGPGGRRAEATSNTDGVDLNLHIMDELFGGNSAFDDFLISIDSVIT